MARPHHFQFAHQFLPAHFFSDVGHCTKLFQMDGKVFLHFLWTTTGEELASEDRLPYELNLEQRKEGKFALYLITMPKPTEESEAFYLLLASDGRKHFYYSLELRKEDSKDIAFHCRWLEDGTCTELGKLGSSDIELFVRKSIKAMKN